MCCNCPLVEVTKKKKKKEKLYLQEGWSTWDYRLTDDSISSVVHYDRLQSVEIFGLETFKHLHPMEVS